MSWACILLIAAADPQAEDTIDLHCGSYCLYVSLKALDVPVETYGAFEEQLGEPTVAEGYSLAQLQESAEHFGAYSLGVQTTIENLRNRPGRFACIAHVRGHHFVNIAEITEEDALIIDAPREYRLPLDTLRSLWDGTALLVSDAPLLREEELPQPINGTLLLGGIAAAIILMGTAAFALRKRSTLGTS